MANPYGLGSHQMVTTSGGGVLVNNESFEDDQQAARQSQQQQNYLLSSQQIDVRMKRHPELQPFVPSDRDKSLTSFTSKIANNKTNKLQSATTNNHVANKFNQMTNNNMDAKTSDPRPKKCVSMTRLDQLAKPKKIFSRDLNKQQQANQYAAPSSSLLSSSTTSTATSSLTTSRSSNSRQTRNVTQTLRQAATAVTTKKDPQLRKQTDIKPNPTPASVHQQRPINPRLIKPKRLSVDNSKEASKQQPPQPAPNVETTKKEEKISNATNNAMSIPEQLVQVKNQSSSHNTDSSLVKLDAQKVKSENLIDVNPQVVAPFELVSVESSPILTPDITKPSDQTFDTSRRLSRNMGRSLFDELQGDAPSISPIPNQIHLESPRQLNESSIIDRMSEMSFNDGHFQSATSILTNDGDVSANGVGLMNNGNFGVHTSTTSSTPTNADILTGKEFDRSHIDSSSISKAEEEFREAARREEEARKKRESIVEGIMSKVKQSS